MSGYAPCGVCGEMPAMHGDHLGHSYVIVPDDAWDASDVTFSSVTGDGLTYQWKLGGKYVTEPLVVWTCGFCGHAKLQHGSCPMCGSYSSRQVTVLDENYPMGQT